MDTTPLLQVRNLKKFFPVRGGFLQKTQTEVRAVDDVTLSIDRGKVLGLVGESGCGKSTVARAVTRLFDVTSGDILLSTEAHATVNLARLGEDALKPFRREIQMVFQDPYSSLNPRMTVGAILEEPLYVHRIGDGAQRRREVGRLLDMVGLKPSWKDRFPHEFSGGQRQRICVARALSLSPSLVICDEAVSALDVSVQAQIITLLKSIREQTGISYLFISHDLAVTEFISDYVAVMYLGKIVETLPADDLSTSVRHPYSCALMGAAPNIEKQKSGPRTLLSGEVPDPAKPPSGCYFHPRCPIAREICARVRPELRQIGGTSHSVACHFVNEEGKQVGLHE